VYDGQVQRSEEGKSNTAIATHSITTPDELVNKMLLQQVVNKLLFPRATTKLAKRPECSSEKRNRTACEKRRTCSIIQCQSICPFERMIIQWYKKAHDAIVMQIAKPVRYKHNRKHQLNLTTAGSIS
jgi:hypothetical protein